MQRIVMAVFLVLAFLTMVVYSYEIEGNWLKAAQAQGVTSTPTIEPSPTVSLTPTVAPTPAGALTYDDALKTYENVATEAIKASGRVLDIIKWLIASIVALIGVAASLIAYLVNRAQTASDVAKEAKTSASEAAQLAKRSAERVNTLSTKVEKIGERAQTTIGEAQTQLEILRRTLETADLRLEELEKSKLVVRDLVSLKKPLELFQVKEHELAILSDDLKRRKWAKWALIEMSKREDPIVRRQCIRVLGVLEEYDEDVIKHLEKMTQVDPERSVRLEAQKAIEKLSRLKIDHETVGN